jgi:hypothetical protein
LGLLKCFQADEMLRHISSVIPCGFTQQQTWNSYVAGCSILVLSTHNSFQRFNCSLFQNVVSWSRLACRLTRRDFSSSFFFQTNVFIFCCLVDYLTI